MSTVSSSSPEKANVATKRIHLSGRFTVAKEFYEFCYELIQLAIKDMERNKISTLKEIIGVEYWEENFVDSGQSWWVGRCVAHMVANNRLPLKFAGCKTNKSLLYQLK